MTVLTRGALQNSHDSDKLSENKEQKYTTPRMLNPHTLRKLYYSFKHFELPVDTFLLTTCPRRVPSAPVVVERGS